MSETRPKRVKKEKSKGRKIFEWILFSVFGALVAFILIGNVISITKREENYGQSIRYGVGTFVILTTSMEPDIPKDSAIITYKEDVSVFKERLARNEIVDITFANINIGIDFEPDTPEFKRVNGGQQVVSNQIMTHRLREVHEDTSVPFGQGRYIFVTSGINHGGVGSLIGQYQILTEKQYLGTVKIANSGLGHFMNFVSSPFGLLLLLLVPAGYLIVVSSIDIFKAVKEDEKATEVITSNNGDKLNKISDADRERLKKELLEEMMKEKLQKKEEKKDE